MEPVIGPATSPDPLARNDIVLSLTILTTVVLNGLMIGAVYALVALGLTLIYGVLHIINFAHGALLSAALFAAFLPTRNSASIPTLLCSCLRPVSLLSVTPCNALSSALRRTATTVICFWWRSASPC